MDKNSVGNCFDEFNDIPQKRKDPTIQILYDYEKHYMEMIRKYKNEIEFIENMLKEFREEQKTFYELLPEISEKLRRDVSVDEEMKEEWVRRLSDNIERSFSLSETLINDYATKSLDEFKQAVNEKLRSI